MSSQTFRCTGILLAAASLGGAGATVAQEVDTSEWSCELCPFSAGYQGDVTAGVTGTSDDSAYFGDATGYDEAGAYGRLDSEGSWTGDSYFMRWMANDLLLESRTAALSGGQPGRWDYALSLRQIPQRTFFTTETIFDRTARDVLGLPAGWVTAPQTTGFTALAGSLQGLDIESDRTAFLIGGRYSLTPRVRASVDYRRQARDGTRILGGPSFTTSSLLPAPFDYVTDEVDLRLDYRGTSSYLGVAWLLSDFSSAAHGLAWATPFTALPGAEVSELSQAPDNRFQQATVRGGYAWSLWATSLSASAAVGEITQDTPFLAYTTNSMIASDPLPRPHLDGRVDITHIAASLSSRPLRKARVRLSYRYDERDNGTERDAWNRVIVDSFTSGDAELNTPYSYKRRRISADASYDLVSMLRLSGGVERRETDRDYQEVAQQTEDTGWLGVRWRFRAWLSVEGRGGTARRDIDRYDEDIGAALGQNPLLRKYDLAYRYREFANFTVSITPAGWPAVLSINGMYADDSFTKSPLGMLSAEEAQLAADLTWTFTDTLSWYLDVGGDRIESVQNGSESFAEPDWRANYNDAFVSVGTGVRIQEIVNKLDLRVDFRKSDGTSEIHVASDTDGEDRFPDFETSYESLRLGVDYRWSPRLLLELGATWQAFQTDDWMLDGVEAATIPAILSLGADPWNDSQVLFGIGFRYELAAPAEQAAEN